MTFCQKTQGIVSQHLFNTEKYKVLDFALTIMFNGIEILISLVCNPV